LLLTLATVFGFLVGGAALAPWFAGVWQCS